MMAMKVESIKLFEKLSLTLSNKSIWIFVWFSVSQYTDQIL